MMLHSEVQRKAQEQIDKVIGHDRLPQFSDKKDLPYIDCILWEVLRWKPIVPLSIAHYTVKQDIYEGYLIPKGTTVFPNVWSVFLYLHCHCLVGSLERVVDNMQGHNE